LEKTKNRGSVTPRLIKNNVQITCAGEKRKKLFPAGMAALCYLLTAPGLLPAGV